MQTTTFPLVLLSFLIVARLVDTAPTSAITPLDTKPDAIGGDLLQYNTILQRRLLAARRDRTDQKPAVSSHPL
jgi:hypothetical protein